MKKNNEEQNKIHVRVATQDETLLPQAEAKQHLIDLFALLLEMHIDQNEVTKESPDEDTHNRCTNYSDQA